MPPRLLQLKHVAFPYALVSTFVKLIQVPYIFCTNADELVTDLDSTYFLICSKESSQDRYDCKLKMANTSHYLLGYVKGHMLQSKSLPQCFVIEFFDTFARGHNFGAYMLKELHALFGQHVLLSCPIQQSILYWQRSGIIEQMMVLCSVYGMDYDEFIAFCTDKLDWSCCLVPSRWDYMRHANISKNTQ